MPRGTDASNPAASHLLRLSEALGAATSERSVPRLGEGSAALDWAASGVMAMTGRANGPPRMTAGAVASAAIGTGALLERLAPPLARLGLDWSALLGERAAIFGHARNGVRSAGGSARLLEARDGWLAVQLPRDDDWRSVPAWLERPIDVEANDDEARWRAVADEVGSGLIAGLVDRARLLGLACAPAPRAPLAAPKLFRSTVETEAPARDVRRPLRILDLSTLWAGPLATSLLALSGASVYKVESPARPDGARRGPPHFFDLVNAHKDPAALDLTAPRDRLCFEAMLEAADVVVESARPRAMRQLGYDAESWTSARPGRIWLSITGYGRDHEWIAFGDDAAVAAGLAWPADGVDELPCFAGDALADPLTGLHAAAVVLALAQSGRGGVVDLALRDVAAYASAIPVEMGSVELIGNPERGFTLRDGDRSAPVAAPRARPRSGIAPPLARPADSALADWTQPRC